MRVMTKRKKMKKKTKVKEAFQNHLRRKVKQNQSQNPADNSTDLPIMTVKRMKKITKMRTRVKEPNHIIRLNHQRRATKKIGLCCKI